MNWLTKAIRRLRAAITPDWLSALGTWAQVVAAVASTVLAWQAVRLAQDYKEEDRMRDELQLTPFLLFLSNYSDGMVELKNVGFGPAIIKKVILRIEDNVISIDKSRMNMSEMKDLANNFQKLADTNVGYDLISEIGKKYNIDDLGKTVKGSVKFPFPGFILPKESSHAVISTNAPNVLRERIHPSDFNAWALRFQSRSRKYNLRICYCSMTEKSCFVTNYAGEAMQKVSSCHDVEAPDL